MKCGYNHCDKGGVVRKKDAIKYKRRYYHEECYNKKIKKAECRNLLSENFNFVGKNISIVIKQLVDDKGNNVDKVLFAIKYIINNKKELNSPYGIGYYLENHEVNKQYKKFLKSKSMDEIKDETTKIKIAKETKIKSKEEGERPSWLKIL